MARTQSDKTHKYKNHPVAAAIAANIAALREGRGWSQNKMGEELGITVSQIARIEVGKIKPNLKVIAKCLEVFGVTATELFTPREKDAKQQRHFDEICKRVRAASAEVLRDVALVLTAGDGGRFLDNPQFKRGPRPRKDGTVDKLEGAPERPYDDEPPKKR
jgi:transcriptional regulator with XRE-family HTH domain